MLEYVLSCSKMCLGVDDVTINFWNEIVVDCLGWVCVFGSVNAFPLVSNYGFSNLHVIEGSHDVSVHTEVWYSIVLWVGDFLGWWVTVLTASS
jgi:hypothetical protein